MGGISGAFLLLPFQMSVLRVLYLPDPKTFKLFVGCVLFYIGIRLIKEIIWRRGRESSPTKTLDEKFREHKGSGFRAGIPADAVVRKVSVSLKRIEYEFWGERFSFSTTGMFVLTFLVGVIGGAYGIGGGSIIAPFCVTIFHLPVYTIAGAALMGSFVTSLAGALFFFTFKKLGTPLH